MTTIATPMSTTPSRTAAIAGADVVVVGALHGVPDDPCRAIADVVLCDGILRPQAELTAALRALRGNFALIVRDRTGQVLASADKIKSTPHLVRA